MVWNEEAQKSHLFEDFKTKEGAHHLEVYSTAASRGKGQTLGYLYQGKYGDSLPQLALPQQSRPGRKNTAQVSMVVLARLRQYFGSILVSSPLSSLCL